MKVSEQKRIDGYWEEGEDDNKNVRNLRNLKMTPISFQSECFVLFNTMKTLN